MCHKTKFVNLAGVLLCTLLPTFQIAAQTPQQRHERIKQTLAAGDLKVASTELNSLRDSGPVRFTANNYDYLLGRLNERAGETAQASANYQAVVARNSLLSQYALWRLSRIARSTGDLTRERESLRQLVAIAPASLLRQAAILRLGQSFYESEDFLAAVAALRPLAESRIKSEARQAMVLTAQSLLAAGQRDEARAVFAKLLTQMPDASRPDDFALAAARGLDELDSGNNPSIKTAQLTESEHLLRASVYHFNRDFEAARRHYLAVSERYSQSPTLANALYQIGRGFYLQLKYDDALKYFEQVIQRFPDNMAARDALSFSAGTYNRLKRTDEAVVAYRSFSERFPDAPNPERPYLNIIDALHEAGRHKEALDWVTQTRSRFRGQIGDALALFAQTRIHLAQGLWPKVVADTNELSKFAELGGTRVAGGTTQNELVFLRAYALEQMGRTADAVSQYLLIPDGRNEYYGQRATQRLLALSRDDKSRSLLESRARGLRSEAQSALTGGQTDQARRAVQSALRLTTDSEVKSELLKMVREVYEKLPSYRFPSLNMVMLGRQEVLDGGMESKNRDPSHQALADELLFLGLYDEGVPELAASSSAGRVATAQDQSNTKATPAAAKTLSTPASLPFDRDYTLAVYSLQGDLANRAVRFGEQLWKKIPDDYVMEVAPRQMVDLLYPLPYRESLLKHTASRGVDPRFVISIARQESRFQPDAKSVAAARGLTQFILETAEQMARQLAVRDFTQDELYNPDTAILFGSQYLANLFQQFPAQPQAVAASYNGGPENVSRWKSRSRSDEPDRYVPELGFAQTKDYVFKVMTNFWMYQQLYDESLERK